VEPRLHEFDGKTRTCSRRGETRQPAKEQATKEKPAERKPAETSLIAKTQGGGEREEGGEDKEIGF